MSNWVEKNQNISFLRRVIFILLHFHFIKLVTGGKLKKQKPKPKSTTFVVSTRQPKTFLKEKRKSLYYCLSLECPQRLNKYISLLYGSCTGASYSLWWELTDRPCLHISCKVGGLLWKHSVQACWAASPGCTYPRGDPSVSYQN